MKPWHLSSQQQGRLEHAHLLRVALPVPVLDVYADRDDRRYVEQVLDVDSRYIRSVRRRDIYVVPRPGQTGNERVMGSIFRPETQNITRLCYPILTVRVIVTKLAQAHRYVTDTMPVQWAIWQEKENETRPI